jgi:hypothetical protein
LNLQEVEHESGRCAGLTQPVQLTGTIIAFFSFHSREKDLPWPPRVYVWNAVGAYATPFFARIAMAQLVVGIVMSHIMPRNTH